MALLQALKGPNVAYFLVGDDWQAIYRFAGSDLALIHDCGVRLGHVRERTLSQTFRFADGILRPSTAFVQRNPEQTQRPLRAASGAKDEGITVVADYNPEGVDRALQDIKTKARGERRSVLVLGRYKRDNPPLLRGNGALQVDFSTVHSAKGREADYVVALYLKDDRMGFPCKVEDDPLLELVLPRSSGYPFAEERRLFYVAMTRARIGAYLITDPVRPSEFVEELLWESGDDLRQLGELRPECPRCQRGRLYDLQGRNNLRCSNYPSCKYFTPRCPNCKEGHAIVKERASICTNQACDDPPTVCPRCGMGVLMVRSGPYSTFLGCSEYGSEPSCRHKQPLRDS